MPTNHRRAIDAANAMNVRLGAVQQMLADYGPVQPVGLHLDAGANHGVPRRLYVLLFQSGNAVAYDEGHRGEDCVPRELRAMMKRWVAFRVTVAEYNKLRRNAQ